MASVPRRPANAGDRAQTHGEARVLERNNYPPYGDLDVRGNPEPLEMGALTSLKAMAGGDRLLPYPELSSYTDGRATVRDVLLALTYGLELVQHGAMLVAGEGQPRAANRKALAILEKKDGIALARTGLVADRAADTRLLHKLLQAAIAFPGSGEPKESPFALQRRIGRNSLIVRVVPGPGLGCWPDPSSRTALLKIYDQDLGLVVDERALCSLYGLTRGEAALATRLVQGKSIEEASAELFISTHTARTHLKRIFMKTNTHRQTELVVRMMFTLL